MQLVMEGNPIQSIGIRGGHLVSTLAGARGSAQNPLATIINDGKGGQNTMYYFLNSGTGYIYNNLLDNTLKLEYRMPYLAEGLPPYRYSLNYRKLQ